jgi:Tol biopolymer transport system component/DNA-binding winged helix-turn-helix (wHTH) protein
MDADIPEKVRLAFYVFDRTTGELTREGIRLRLEKQPAIVLEMLIAAHGQLVTRKQLVAALWPGEVSGEFDRRLDKALAKLRAALHDSPHAPVFVETLKGRGYRMIREIAFEPSATPRNGNSDRTFSDAKAAVQPERTASFRAKSQGRKPWSSWRIFAYFGLPGLAVLMIMFLSVAAAYSWRYNHSLQVTDYTQLTHDGWRKLLVGVDRSYFYLRAASDWHTLDRISFANGSTTTVPLALSQVDVLGLATDGSQFLLTGVNQNQPGLWAVHLPDGAWTNLAPGVQVTAATWSPYRTRILYADANGKFYTMRSDGAEVRAWNVNGGQNGNSWITDLRWSPDGTRLRFTRDHAIWEIKPDGSGAHPVFPGLFAGSWQCCGRWSSDGKLFVFSVRDSLFSSVLPSSQLWASEEGGLLGRIFHKDPVRLTSGPMRWSSAYPSPEDNTTIYARGVVLRGQLVRLNDRTGAWEPFLAGISAQYVADSPDKRFLCYVSFPEGILWKTWRDGSHPVQLAGAQLHPASPRWSPDGSLIVFDSTGASGVTQSWAISSSGGAPYRLFPDAENAQSDPVWSPDGKQLAYSTHARERSSASATIRLYNLTTHTTATIPGSENMSSARWSPDGRFLIGINHATRSLWRFDFATKKWTHLEDEQAEYPCISSNSRWIYFLRPFAHAGIYRIPSTGGKEERIADLTHVPITGFDSIWFGLDDKDTPLLLKDTGMDDIYALHLR